MTLITTYNEFLDIFVAIVLIVAICHFAVSAFLAFVLKLFVQFFKDLCFAIVYINN